MGTHVRTSVRRRARAVTSAAAFAALALLILATCGTGLVLAAADDDIPGSVFAVGSTLNGTVDPSSDPNDIHGIWLNAGEEIRVTCLPTSTTSDSTPRKAHFSFISPNAPSVAASKDHVIAQYKNLWKGEYLTMYADFEYVAPRSGTYFARVEAAEGLFGYSLEVRYTGRPAYPSADANDIPGLPRGLGTVAGVVDTRLDRNDVYAVKLIAGREVTMSLQPTREDNGADNHLTGTARLRLLSPDSTSVGSYGAYHEVVPEAAAFNSESDDRDEIATISYTPAETGVYYIWIQASSLVTNFPYALTVGGYAEFPDTPPPHETTFPDVDENHPYYTAIEGMADAGIISGYKNGTFGPFNPVLRAQFAKMICGTLGIPVDESLVPPFSDLGWDDPATLYPHEYVAAAFANGITQGLTPSTFGPYVDITRAQVITMVVRAADNLRPGVLQDPPPGFVCAIPNFSDTHYPNLRKAEYNGLLSGLQGFGGGWDPWARSSRGECAQVLWNLLSMIVAE